MNTIKIFFYFFIYFSYTLNYKILRKNTFNYSDDKHEVKLNIRLIVLGIVIILIIILIILFCVYRKKCGRKKRIISRNSIANIIIYSIQRNNSNQNCINKEQLKKYYILQNIIQPFYYTDDSIINENFNNNRCVICLLLFKKYKSKICKTPCNHYFHFYCIQKLILDGNNIKCPLCKFDFNDCLINIDINYDEITEIILKEEDNPINESNDNNKETEKYFENDKLHLKNNVEYENKNFNNETNEIKSDL